MPDWRTDLRDRLSQLHLSAAREAEIIEELSQHLDARYAELRDSGVAEPDARRLALEELREHDTLARAMGTLRQAHVPETIAPGTPRARFGADLWQDVRYGARMLRKQPIFTLSAILTLALGIGANTAIFSLVNAMLLQRLPVENRDRLVYVSRGRNGVFSYPMYAAMRDGNKSFEQLAVWGGIAASLNTNDSTELITGLIVTGNLFEMLGVKAAQGRLLAPSDDVTPNAHPVAVISYDFWQTRFAGRADIVGREILLNGRRFTMVGVTPQNFPGPQLGATRNIYVPMMMQALIRPPRAGYSGEQNPDLLTNPYNGWLFGMGLLRPGTSAAAGAAELGALATTFARSVPSRTPPPPGTPPSVVTVTTVPIDEGDPNQRGRMQAIALLLGGVVGAVLLIACANIANLLLARAAARRRELAVRLAVGASRARLVRQLLTESILLALGGGLAGVALAWTVVRAFEASPPPAGALPVALEFSIDGRVLLFALAVSVATGILFGVAPALRASRPGLVPALKNATSDADDRPRRVTLTKFLVVAEVALSLVLLVAAGLFVRSLRAAHETNPGFDAHKLVAAPLSINLLRYTSDQGRQFYRNVVERIERLPGVESASVARIAVLTGGGRVLSLLIEGRDGPPEPSQGEGGGVATNNPNAINVNIVGPQFFETLGIQLLAGRDFTEADTVNRPLVVVVNETMATTHFPNQNPIGKRVNFGGINGPWREIVGVVRNSKYATLGEPALSVGYLPLAQNHETGTTLYVRTSVEPASLVASIRREIQAVEPNLPVPNIQTVSDTIAASLYAPRMGAWLLSVFGGLALLLAAIGVYGVLSFTISRRTREMGIRLALGAERSEVFRLVVRDGMVLVAIGVVIGIAAGLASTRSLGSFLYSVPTSDWVTYSTTIGILVAVGLVACAIPARRAMRVPPVIALRSE
jgi:predicted permease